LKNDDEVRQVSRDALLLITKSTELFTQYLTQNVYSSACQERGKVVKGTGNLSVSSLKVNDLVYAIHNNNALTFLSEDFPKEEKINNSKRSKMEVDTVDLDKNDDNVSSINNKKLKVANLLSSATFFQAKSLKSNNVDQSVDV
jgi:hypothetical protein